MRGVSRALCVTQIIYNKSVRSRAKNDEFEKIVDLFNEAQLGKHENNDEDNLFSLIDINFFCIIQVTTRRQFQDEIHQLQVIHRLYTIVSSILAYL